MEPDPAFQKSCSRVFNSYYCLVFFLCLAVCLQRTGYHLHKFIKTPLQKRFNLSSYYWNIGFVFEYSGYLALFPVFPLLQRMDRRPLWISLGLSMSLLGYFLSMVPLFWENWNGFKWSDKGPSSSQDSSICPDTRERSLKLEPLERSLEVYWVYCGYLLHGVGSSLVLSTALLLADDNIHQKRAPFYLGLLISAGLLPALLADVLLRYGVNQFHVVPGLPVEPFEHTFVPAWWFGYSVLGFINLLLIFPFLCFPRALSRGAQIPEYQFTDLHSSFRLLRSSLYRLMKNKVYLFSLLSEFFLNTAYMAVSEHYTTFVHYYFNAQNQDAADFFVKMSYWGFGASLFFTLVSSLVIYWYSFKSRYIGAWNVISSLLGITFGLGLFFLRCPPQEYLHDDIKATELPCNSMCGCDSSSYNPVCSENGEHFFLSPCHAGCTVVNTIPAVLTKTGEVSYEYENCSCVLAASNSTSFEPLPNWLLKDPAPSKNETWSARPGPCPRVCTFSYYVFSSLVVIFSAFLYSGPLGVPRLIIQLRCVLQEDKNVAIFIKFMAAIFAANMAERWIFTVVIENTCIHYQLLEYGEECVLYDTDALSHYFYIAVIIVFIIAFVLELITFNFVGSLQLYGSPGSELDEGDTILINAKKTKSAQMKSNLLHVAGQL